RMRAAGLALLLGILPGCRFEGALVGPTARPSASVRPTASASPVKKPAASADPDDGWATEAVSWTAEVPTAARVGQVVSLNATAVVGSSSCTRFVGATARADEDTRTVRLSGTKEVAPDGPCTRDITTESPPLSFTPKTAGTWRLEGPGLEGLTFEVLPATAPSPSPSAQQAG
ncbi:MAG: hypothetical protein VKS61_11680, partial [Candidatus Sericytochromatia bacterium]|nr:hypothetical protein [Candidatus Sericytochromatia bacterium]